MKTLTSIEEEIIRLTLRYNGGCMTRAARSLGIGRSTLYRRVNDLGIDGYISWANQTAADDDCFLCRAVGLTRQVRR